MKEGDSGDLIGIKKKPRILLISLIIIIIAIIIIFIIIWKIIYFHNFINSTNEVLNVTEGVIKNENSICDSSFYGQNNKNKSNSYDDDLNHFNKNEIVFSSKLHDLEYNGSTIMYAQAYDWTCKNGTIFKNVSIYESYSPCIDSSGAILGSNNFIGYKYSIHDVNNTPVEFGALSMGMNIGEYSILLSNQGNEILNQSPDNAKVDALGLESLQYIAMVSKIDNILLKLYNQFQISGWTKDRMIKLDNYANHIPIPSEDQINSVEIKSSCIEMFTLSRDETLLVNKISKLDSALLMKPSKDNICSFTDKYQKENAIKILSKAQDESNLYNALTERLYLNLFVKCGANLYIVMGQMNSNPNYGNQIACIDDYLENVSKNINETI